MMSCKRKGGVMGRYKLPESQKRKQRIYYLTPDERVLMDEFALKLRTQGAKNDK